MANAVRLPWSELLTVFRTDNAPFMYIALWLWTAVFGDSEFALRSLSTAAYAAAVLLTGLAASVRGPVAAIMAATLVASSVRIGLMHAATARPYALLAALCATAVFLTIRWLDHSEATHTSKWLGVASLTTVHVLGLLTHPTYIFVLTACALAGTISRWKVRESLVAAGAALLVYVAVWGRVLWATVRTQATSWMRSPTFADIKDAYLFLWGTGPGFMLVGAMLVLVLTSVSPLQDALKDKRARWIAVATLIGWTTPILISVVQPVFLPARTPALLLPLTSVFVAFVLAAVASRMAVLVLAGVFLIAGFTQVVSVARRGDPTPSRASLQSMLSDVKCGETLVAVGLAHATVDYYGRQLIVPGCVAVQRFPREMLNWTGRLTNADEMQAIRAEGVQLVARMASTADNIWVLTADTGMGHEASAIFMAAARARLVCDDPRPLKGAFFDHVTRCRP